LETRIEKIVHGGYGLCRLEDGKVCLVRYGVPGDVVDIEYGEGKGTVFGWIKTVVKPSEKRTEPPCPVFMRCGGCDFQHVKYEYELEAKRGIVKEDLKRLGGLDRIPELKILSSNPYGYRNHAQISFDRRGVFGFFARDSHGLIQIPDEGCAILDPRINDFLKKIRDRVQFNRRGSFRIRTGFDRVYKKGIPGVDDDKYCIHKVCGLTLRTGIDDFFQINRYLIEDWIEVIRNYIEPDKNDILLDLFCGSGVIGLAIAREVGRVMGIEGNGRAVKNARYNSQQNGIGNASFSRADLYGSVRELEECNKVVVNPPRAGLTEELIDVLVEINPQIIVYSSCDSSTFSRDIKYFLTRGYMLSDATVVDMFPRTRHVEVVGKLVRF